MSDRPTTIWGIDADAAAGLLAFCVVYFGGLVTWAYLTAQTPGDVATPEQREMSVTGGALMAVMLGIPALGGHALAFGWVRRNLRKLRLAPLLATQCLVAAASSQAPIFLGPGDSGWRLAAFITTPANLTLLLYGALEVLLRWRDASLRTEA